MVAPVMDMLEMVLDFLWFDQNVGRFPNFESSQRSSPAGLLIATVEPDLSLLLLIGGNTCWFSSRALSDREVSKGKHQRIVFYSITEMLLLRHSHLSLEDYVKALYKTLDSITCEKYN